MARNGVNPHGETNYVYTLLGSTLKFSLSHLYRLIADLAEGNGRISPAQAPVSVDVFRGGKTKNTRCDGAYA
jgi:hypothetical protein